MTYPAVDFDPLGDITGWTVVDSHTTFTTDATISETIYRKGITIDGCAITVADPGVWVYRADPANPPSPVRLLNGGSLTGAKVKVGYDGTPVAGFDPIGGTHDPADYVCTGPSSENGEIHLSEFLLTHVAEGFALQEERITLNHGVVGPFYIDDPDGHMDAFQTTGHCNASVVEVRIIGEHVAGSLTEKSLRAFQIETTLAAMVSLIVDRCFISWIGALGFSGDTTVFPINELVITNNIFDADSGADAIDADLIDDITTRYENRWSDTGSLITGDQVAPGETLAASHTGTPGTQSGTGSLTFTLPAAAVVGQWIRVDVFAEDGQASPGTTDWTAPAGDDWQFIGSSAGTLSTTDMAVFRRLVKAGDTPSVTTFAFSCTAGAACIGAIDLIQDADLVAAWVDFTQIEHSTQINPLTHPGITTTEDDMLVGVSVGSNEGVASFTATTPAVQTERTDAGAGRRLATYGFDQAATGPTGGLAYTMEAIHRGAILAFGVPGAPVPPAAPANPAAVADSSSQITVTWDNVADETGFRVERSPDGVGSWVDVSGNLAADTLSYADTGLTASTQYFYRVYAFNAAGDSSPSSTVNATTSAASGGGNRMGGTGAIRKPPRRSR